MLVRFWVLSWFLLCCFYNLHLYILVQSYSSELFFGVVRFVNPLTRVCFSLSCMICLLTLDRDKPYRVIILICQLYMFIPSCIEFIVCDKILLCRNFLHSYWMGCMKI